jgi:O-Antigen ligase
LSQHADDLLERRRLDRRGKSARRSAQAFFQFTDWTLPTALAASALAAVVVGDAVTISYGRAIVLVYLVVALAASACLGLLGLALLLTATLPWLVVIGDLLPRLTATFTAGAAVALVILVVVPRSDGTNASLLLRIGIVCFYGPVLISLARNGSGEQLIQAAKYTVFPAMVFAVTEARNSRNLRSLRTVALWSAIAAVTVNLILGLAGINVTTHDRGTYQAGEILGLGGEHDVALLAGCVTAASVAAAASLKWIPIAAVGAIATVATGVRSTLPGLAVLVIARMFASGARIRTIVLVGLAVLAVFVSGAAHVVESRYQTAQSRGEFKSFSALGSGRGKVYSAAFDGWRSSPPLDWIIGTGLRSIPRFEQERLGDYARALTGHSDVIEVGVQLGIVGLFGLLVIWWVLITRAPLKSILLVLGSFALFNGALEYSAPLVLALLFTTGLNNAPDRLPSHRRPWPSPSVQRSEVLLRTPK